MAIGVAESAAKVKEPEKEERSADTFRISLYQFLRGKKEFSVVAVRDEAHAGELRKRAGFYDGIQPKDIVLEIDGPKIEGIDSPLDDKRQIGLIRDEDGQSYISGIFAWEGRHPVDWINGDEARGLQASYLSLFELPCDLADAKKGDLLVFLGVIEGEEVVTRLFGVIRKRQTPQE